MALLYKDGVLAEDTWRAAAVDGGDAVPPSGTILTLAAWKTSCLKRKGEQSAAADGQETPDATVGLLNRPGLRKLQGSAEHAQVRVVT